MLSKDTVKKENNAQQKKEFSPFYEVLADWISARLGVPIFGALLASCIPGGIFFVLHYVCTVGETFENFSIHFHVWSWMIGFMIIAAALCLYYATDTLKGIFLHIDSGQNVQQQQYLPRLNHTLSNTNFILAGLFFGLFNVWMGKVFGVPYESTTAQLSIYTGFFLVGFVCGMAAWGIYGVVVIMKVLTEKKMVQPDFTAPDNCGGTQFLGNAFVKFSAVTLIMGVIISIYILFTWWAHQESMLPRMAIGMWITFPYILSLVVLAAPAVLVNRVLVKYKLHQEKHFSDMLANDRTLLGQKDLDIEIKKGVAAKLEWVSKDRATLHHMGTWPFGKVQGVQYSLVFFGNMFVSSKSIEKALSISLPPEIQQIIKEILSA